MFTTLYVVHVATTEVSWQLRPKLLYNFCRQYETYT